MEGATINPDNLIQTTTDSRMGSTIVRTTGIQTRKTLVETVLEMRATTVDPPPQRPCGVGAVPCGALDMINL